MDERLRSRSASAWSLRVIERMLVGTTRYVVSATVCLTCLFETPAHAEETLLSTEIRAGLFPPSFRWSNHLPTAAPFIDNAEKSLYFVPSLGVRFYPRGSHGATVDLDYRLDIDSGDPFCINIFDTCPDTFQIDFAVVHAGYAYRHIVESPKRPYRHAWAFTPHVSLATGVAISEHSVAGIPHSSAVVGGRAGFDIDLHLRRFFLGWSFSYEILGHTRGSIHYSQFFAWNAIPIFRIGGVIGRRVQREPPEFEHSILP